MPHFLDVMTSPDLPGPLRPLWRLLDLLAADAGAILTLASAVMAASGLVVAAWRGRVASAPATVQVPGRTMPREEALGHVAG